jgi:hypothetical protein
MTTVAIPKEANQVLASIPSFKKTVWFDSQMDHLIYLDEDCNYRADRVDDILTLLYHPYSDDLVGVKLKGIRAEYEKLFEASAKPDDDFVEFVNLIGGIMIRRWTHDNDMKTAAETRRDGWLAKYQAARKFVGAKRNAKAPRNLDEIALAA